MTRFFQSDLVRLFKKISKNFSCLRKYPGIFVNTCDIRMRGKHGYRSILHFDENFIIFL